METPVTDASKASPIPERHRTLTIYTSTRHLFLFAHGLLAGLALFHCIALFASTPPRQPDWTLFIRLYTPLSVIFKTLYQVLVALCCVSCLCRLDLLGGGGFLDRRRLLDHGASLVTALMYFAAATLTHLCDVTVMRLLHETLSGSSVAGDLVLAPDLVDELMRWKIMDAVRTGCVGLGWWLMACRWPRDRLLMHMEQKTF